MAIAAECADHCTTITLGETFNFNDVHLFRSAYMDHPARRYIIDFRHTHAMDSAALGMLLNMRNTLELNTDDIALVNCGSSIRRVFCISRFEKKFKIT